MNVKRESFVKVLGRTVRVPNWAIVERGRWSAERIARVERQAQALGDLQAFVMKSPLFPVAIVAGVYGALYTAVWAVETLVGILL